MLLHIVNKSPFAHDALASCLRHVLPPAGILLIEDAVYAAANGTAYAALVQDALARLPVYALKPDLLARGLLAHALPGVTLVDYDGFVDLVAQYEKTQTWL
jgi:tRNA 2-thiouridine synthesizing protein B